jgi:hypothetical protein
MGTMFTMTTLPTVKHKSYIPQVLHHGRRSTPKTRLMLCTGGTLTMAPIQPTGAWRPSKCAPLLSSYLQEMNEPKYPDMPGPTRAHPCRLLRDLGPTSGPDWHKTFVPTICIAFDLPVVITGTAYHGVRRYGTVHARKSRWKPVAFYWQPNTTLHAPSGRPTESNHGSIRVPRFHQRSHHILSRSTPPSLPLHQGQYA